MLSTGLIAATKAAEGRLPKEKKNGLGRSRPAELNVDSIGQDIDCC